MRGEGLPSAAPLGPPARDAWHAYRDALVAGHRPAVPLAYARFLDRLGAEPAVVGERFCRWLCEGIFRHPGARPPYPLIRDVLLPYHVGGIVRGPAAPHLRWLA